MFSEENKTVAVKHEIQLLFRIHILYRDNGVTANPSGTETTKGFGNADNPQANPRDGLAN
jgi:hypothetical protein